MLWNYLRLLGGPLFLVRLVQCAELGPLVACQFQSHIEEHQRVRLVAGQLAPQPTRSICSIAASCRRLDQSSNCASASSSAFFRLSVRGSAAWKISSRRCGLLGLSIRALSRYCSEFHHLGDSGLVPGWRRVRRQGTEPPRGRANRPAMTVDFITGCPTIRPGYPVTFTARAANTYGNTAEEVGGGKRAHAGLWHVSCREVPIRGRRAPQTRGIGLRPCRLTQFRLPVGGSRIASLAPVFRRKREDRYPTGVAGSADSRMHPAGG